MFAGFVFFASLGDLLLAINLLACLRRTAIDGTTKRADLCRHPSRVTFGFPTTGERVAMSSMSTGLSRQEKRASPSPSVAPLAVPPQEAARLLSLGIWRIYALMRTGELVSYRDGRARRITMASIHDRMARQIAAAHDEGWRRITPNPSPRRKARGVG